MRPCERLAAVAFGRSSRLAVIAAACLSVSMHARQAPVYKAEVDVIPVDLVVVDEEGRPVPGLRPEDFQVTVDGRPRRVITAQFLSSAASRGTPIAEAGRKTGWDIDAAFEDVYIGNDRSAGLQAAPSRTVMIAIDQSGFSADAGRNAAAATRGLLDLLHPNDRVGLAVFPGPGPFVRPTRDHERVRRALSLVSGTAELPPRSEIALNVTDALAWNSGDQISRDVVAQRYCSPMAAATCPSELDRAAAGVISYAQRQSLVSLVALHDVIRAATLDGSSSAIVLVSAGVYASGRATQLGLDGELRSLGRLAATSRAMLYALYVESGFLDRDSMERTRIAGFSTEDGDLRLDGLRTLAGLAGGTVMRVGLGNEASFRRVSLELSAYYLLGIEGTPADRDGRRHRLRVTVPRPGVTVRTREDLYLEPAKKLTGEEAVREALGAPDLERALPIRLSTQMMREPGTDKVRLVISASIGRDANGPARVRVGYVIRGAGAGATAAISDIQDRELPVVGTGADASLSYLETAQLTAGRYLLRVAAVDEKGRLGSVQQVIDATLVAGDGGTFSDVLLVDPARAHQGTFTPVADGRMTGDAVQAFLEIYPSQGQAVEAVAFDISDTPGGPAVVAGSVPPEKREDGRLVAGVNFELRALPPGAYMLNARVLDGERVLGRVSRPFLLERPAVSTAGGAEPRAALAFAATGSLVRGFAREDALGTDALDYFLNRMHASETVAGGEEIAEAAAAVRAARFDAALAALPDQPDVLSVAFLKGLALLGQGRLEPAAEQFKAALLIADDFLPAAFYLGACHAAGGRDREAVGAWQTSLVSETDSRIIYEVLADALLRLNDGRQAEAIIAEARERWPDDDVFVPRLAAAKVILGRRAEALSVLEPYLERHPTDSEPLFLAIRLLYEAHDGGKPLKGSAEDRTLAAKYGALYGETGGVNLPLVRRWVAAMTK
ncbi:MAG TPA: VWA domain-containing protein [Vicinamibacterales bacterium]|nr:VWA domain-containing protein [Vicinamibacterales bacterium]